MLILPSRRVVRPYEKPSFEHTQRYGLDRRNAKVSVDGLVGCWLMNEGGGNTVADLSGNRNTGILTNDMSWGFGKKGSAIEGQGSSDYIVCPPDIVKNGQPEFTVVFSFLPHTCDTKYRALAGTWKADSSAGWVFQITDEWNNATPQGIMCGRVATGNQQAFSPNNTVVLNEWSFAAAVFHPVGTVPEIYFACETKSLSKLTTKNNLAGSGTFGDDSSENLTLFAQTGALTDCFDGLIEYIYIYNRALSASEITLLYREPFCQLWQPKTQIVVGWVSGVDVTVQPSAVTCICAVQAPSVTLDWTVTLSVVTSTASVQAPTVAPNKTATPSAVTIICAVQAPTVAKELTVSPSEVTSTGAVQSPTVDLQKTVSPSEVTVTCAVQAPTIAPNKTVTPSVVTSTGTVQVTTVTTELTVSPLEVTSTASVQAPSVNIAGAAITFQPSEITCVAAVQAPTATYDMVVSPATVTATATVQAPTIDTGALVCMAALFLMLNRKR